MQNAAQKAVRTLVDAGFAAFICGGAVRDLQLGRTPKDFDVTTSATPKQVNKLFSGDTKFVGAHFGVSLVHVDGVELEVATFRTDGNYANNRHPDSVTFTSDVREDVQRRDFSVNGLLMDVNGEVVDYVGGLEDLQNKVLRCVGNPNVRFAEDALRMLRAVRFACQLGFRLDHQTASAIKSLAHTVQVVSAERVQVELSKALVADAARAVTLLDETGLLPFVLPEVAEMKGVEQGAEHHPEGDVFMHTVKALSNLKSNCSLTLALAVLLHDVGKKSTFACSNGKVTFHGHAEVGVGQAETVLRRLKFSNDVVDTVTSHVGQHMKFFDAQKMRRNTLLRFVRQAQFKELLELHRADCYASNGDFSTHTFMHEFLAAQTTENLNPARLLTGNDLVEMGLQPGPLFKTLLMAVEDAQLNGQVNTHEEAVRLVQDLTASSGSSL